MNKGPDCYKKMLFACLSFNNYGRICEHDIFMIMELFKLQDSFAFYQNLIYAENIPRNYKTLSDKSDSMFFKAFVKDIKYLSRIINFRKRIFGFEDADTNTGIE